LLELQLRRDLAFELAPFHINVHVSKPASLIHIYDTMGFTSLCRVSSSAKYLA
jgi:hypothetical protein